VSVLAVSPRPGQAQRSDWARLIPGETTRAQFGANKAAQSIGTLPFNGERGNTGERQSALSLLLPAPLKARTAWNWLRSMASDWVLISLNWLLVGASLVPLRMLFPRVRSFAYDAGSPSSLLGMAVLHAALITLMGYSEGLHLAGSKRDPSRILATSIFWATFLLCLAYLLQGEPWTTAGLLCATAPLHFVALWMWRTRLAGAERVAGADKVRNVLIVGAGGVGRRIASYVAQNSACGRRVCGFLDDDRPLRNGVVGRVADLARVARREFADEVILAAPRNSHLTREVLHEAMRLHLDVEIVPDLFGFRPVQPHIEEVGEVPLLSLHAERLPALSLFCKRLLDVIAASFGLLFLLPLLACIALWIKLDSEGPIFYCAQRAGRKGRLFTCYKFRTMVNDADALKIRMQKENQRRGPFFKIAGDPRITRSGRHLRRYSLDELPQLWNVLRGEMSLVGPRPHPVDDVAGYEMEHLGRLDVTPGLTGLWQVTARRDPSFQRGMELDREYIRSWSLGLDARILLKTFAAVIQGSGQ
jgi:exopolysaccharide biosynthesis polyprenyl glycosylphosphotransferase